MVLTRDAKGGAKKGVNQLISSQRRTNVSLVSGDGHQIEAQKMILAAPIHFVEVKTSTSTDLHESELDSKFQWIDINSLRFAGFPIFMG